MDDRIRKLWQRGLAYFNQGNLDAAQASFESILARDPGNGPARFRMSMIAMRRGNYLRAIDLAREARRIAPNQIEVNTHLARCLLQAGYAVEAAQIAQSIEAQAMVDGSAVVLESLGTLFHLLGDSQRALPLLELANKQRPRQTGLLCMRGQVLKACARVDDAERDLESAIAIEPANPQAHWQLAALRHWTDSRNHVDRLQAILPRAGATSELDLIRYALFKELDDLDRTEAAWPVLEPALTARGNRQRAAEMSEIELFDAVRQRFTPESFPLLAPAGHAPGPIFLVGLPRSGMTLLATILGRHSQIRTTGLKTHFLQLYAQMGGPQLLQGLKHALLQPNPDLDYAELGRRFLAAHGGDSGGKAHFIEHQPLNFLFLAHVRRALPNAKILHMQRDASDACFSLLCQPERESSAAIFDPVRLAEHHLAHERLLQHWHQLMPGSILDVQYESLIEKPEMVLRVVLAFLGLRYEAGMLAGTNLHRDRIGRWQRYAGPLAAMRKLLQAAEPAEDVSA